MSTKGMVALTQLKIAGLACFDLEAGVIAPLCKVVIVASERQL
jgi:hypothetical protein